MAKLVLSDVQFVKLTVDKEPPAVTLQVQGADGATVLSVKVGSDLNVLVAGSAVTVVAEIGEDGLVGIGAWPKMDKPSLPDLPAPPSKPGDTPDHELPGEPEPSSTQE